MSLQSERGGSYSCTMLFDDLGYVSELFDDLGYVPDEAFLPECIKLKLPGRLADMKRHKDWKAQHPEAKVDSAAEILCEYMKSKLAGRFTDTA